MNRSHPLLLVVITGLVTAFLIYLTPLKHLSIVPPNPQDISARDFYAEYKANPDKYLFIDVRDAHSYRTSHAAGSVSHPIASLYDLRNEFPKTELKSE